MRTVTLILLISFAIGIIPVYSIQGQCPALDPEPKTKKPEVPQEYEAPSTCQFPYGDEDNNQNQLDRPPSNEMKEPKDVQELDGLCPNAREDAKLEKTHIPCPKDNQPNELLYSSQEEVQPLLQCKKCDLQVNSDSTAVFLKCYACSELPVSQCQIMWTLQKIIRNARLSATNKLIRSSSQIVQPITQEADLSTSDISSYNIGQTIHGFNVTEIDKIEEFNVTAIKLIHEKTKAEYLHLYRPDNNNVFCVSFRTTPMDSTGAPHILEHTVLCGSQLFPVRDPFFKMLNRSLATFMNAMTASDYTMYPYSTQNMTDYHNLQKIYLDAAFRPHLNELDFMQEGWRFENVNLQDEKSELTIKGIVYNEMKGSFSENDNILCQKVQNLLLPDHTYGVISGGDPLKIPDLTYEALKKFHKDHYHPSNSRVFSYGNFPLTPTLEYINNQYFSKYDYQEPKHTLVPKQKRWEAPKTEHITCRFDNLGGPLEKQNSICVALLMNNITDNYETFLMQFVTELLIRGPSSPFYKNLIEPNFSGGYTPCTGYDNQPLDCYFTIGLKGLDKKDFGKVVELFDKTISDVIKSGFDPKHIESVLHRYELGIKHESTNFGLNLLFGISAVWNHNGNVIESLKINDCINKLKTELKNDERYLQKVVEKFLKSNKHRLILSMSPDKDYEKKQKDLEKKMIQEKVKSLSADQKKTVRVKALELQKQQMMIPNTNILPTLTIGDINNEVEKVQSEMISIKPIHTQVNKVNTNGITYFRGVLSTSHLTPEQHMMLPLFCYIITKLGTKSMNYRDFESLIDRKTSGLHLNIHIAESLFQLHTYEQGISIFSYCLDKNIQSMFDLWSEVFNNLALKDVQRFKTLVHLYVSDLTHGIADAGHSYAMQSACGLVSGAGYQKDLLTGLQHISYMKRLVKTHSYEAMLKELSNIASLIFDKNKLRCCLNVLPDSREQALSTYEHFVNDLPGNQLGKPNEKAYTTTKVWSPNEAVQCQHHVLNVPVHFCSKGILTAPFVDPDYPKLKILAKILTSKFLHPELREKQGAYGGGARVTSDGVFCFYSYRDPNHLQTLDVFDNTYNWIEKDLRKVTEQDILEAKLGVFQAVDAPIPPSSKGLDEFLKGLTRDVLMRFRADIMTVDLKGLIEVGEKYLCQKCKYLSSKVILGPKSKDLNTSKRTDELWTVIDKEM